MDSMDLLSSIAVILVLVVSISGFVVWVTNSIKELRAKVGEMFSVIDKKVPFTETDVLNALNYHHLTVDESDSKPNEYISFCSNQMRYVILTNNLPCPSIRCYFSIDPENTDLDLMERIAGEVTLNYMLVKVFVSREAASYFLQVDLAADSYVSFCNVLPTYLEGLTRGHQAIIDLYDERTSKKEETTQNALYAAAFAAQIDAAGNIIAS